MNGCSQAFSSNNHPIVAVPRLTFLSFDFCGFNYSSSVCGNPRNTGLLRFKACWISAAPPPTLGMNDLCAHGMLWTSLAHWFLAADQLSGCLSWYCSTCVQVTPLPLTMAPGLKAVLCTWLPFSAKVRRPSSCVTQEVEVSTHWVLSVHHQCHSNYKGL